MSSLQNQLKNCVHKWFALVLLFSFFAICDSDCPIWGIIDGFKREGLEKGKVSQFRLVMDCKVCSRGQIFLNNHRINQ